MKVLEARKSYLFKRLKNILNDRDPEEAENIRNEFKLLEAETLAHVTEEDEQQEEKLDKMLRFIENYTRIEEERNLKVHEVL